MTKEVFDEVRLRGVESGYVSIVVLCSGGLGREGEGGDFRGGGGADGELRMLLLGDPGEGAVSASAWESSGGGPGGGDGGGG